MRSTITLVKSLQICQSKMARVAVSNRLSFLYVNVMILKPTPENARASSICLERRFDSQSAVN